MLRESVSDTDQKRVLFSFKYSSNFRQTAPKRFPELGNVASAVWSLPARASWSPLNLLPSCDSPQQAPSQAERTLSACQESTEVCTVLFYRNLWNPAESCGAIAVPPPCGESTPCCLHSPCIAAGRRAGMEDMGSSPVSFFSPTLRDQPSIPTQTQYLRCDFH